MTELAEAVRTDKHAARARLDVLRGIIEEKRHELAQSWERGFALSKVTSLRSSIQGCAEEINAIRRRWGYAEWTREGTAPPPDAGDAAAANGGAK